MDIQVHGSEYSDDIKSGLSELAGNVKEVLCFVKKLLVFDIGINCDEERSLLMFMLMRYKYDLVKLRANIPGRNDKDLVSELIKSLEIVIRHKRFEGINSSGDFIETESIIKYPYVATVFKNYMRFLKLIKRCVLCVRVMSDINRVSWNDEQVLIGTLRNRQQLEIILKNKFYHIPKSIIPDDKTDISYIAIYQSKNLFGRGAGIKYFGKVLSKEIIKRSEIYEIPSESEEIYVRYNIGEWKSLGNTISAGHSGNVVGFTNLYMLLRADVTNELYFGDENEYKLYRSIKTSLQKGYDRVATKYNGCVIAISKGNISVYKNRILVYNIPVRDYMKNPVSRFYAITKICKGAD